jgi:pilus assembly protein CpaF
MRDRSPPLLVARLAPEDLNPFGRTPEQEARLRRTIGDILADPDLELSPTPALVAAVEAAVCGLGPLQPLVDDPLVGDILVNGPHEIFIERSGRLERTSVSLGSAREVIEISERIAALAGRELSVAHPIVDARMPDGSRVNAVIPPVGGPYLSIRKFNRLRLDLSPGGRHGRSWIEEGGLDPAMAEVVTRLVRARANILVAGETGAGKTTFLRTVTDLFDETERIGVVEDTAELALENPDRFNLETLHPHDLSVGEADTRLLDVGDLVANALRMRPDRLIVGEIRLPKEAFYTLQALHTGHDGSATTIHASSAEDALFRLELLARQSMRDLTVTAVDGLTPDGMYAMTDVFRAEAGPGSDEIRFVANAAWTPSPRLLARLELEGERWS